MTFYIHMQYYQDYFIIFLFIYILAPWISRRHCEDYLSWWNSGDKICKWQNQSEG